MTKTLKILPGCSDHPHADWLIGPVGVHRDSDLIAQSNWAVVTEAYLAADPDQIDHEVHRFGHFAVGGILEVAYRPGSAVAGIAAHFRMALENYPILNEDHHSQMEAEAIDDNMNDILDDLREDLRKEFHTWPEWSDEDDDRLDDLDWALIEKAAHDLGEYTGEGWIKYSKSDVGKIAIKLQTHFGYEA